jgi:hypothetical protein
MKLMERASAGCGIIFSAIAAHVLALYYCLMLLAAASRRRMKPKARYLNFLTRKSNSYGNI